MDAAELPPLPASVAVSKILSGEMEAATGSSAAPLPPPCQEMVFGGHKGSGFDSSHKDLTNKGATGAERTVFRSRKDGSDTNGLESELLAVKLEVNGKEEDLGDVDRCDVSMPEGKQASRKLMKNGISLSSKRQRSQTEIPPITGGLDNHNDSSKKTGNDCAEKLRKSKQKFVQDNKRNDKKSVRAGGKTKLDGVLASCDSVSGASSILGTYALKPEFRSINELVNEVTLSELLDGSYKSPEICLDKVKKAANANDGILQSVRKSCSILTPNGMASSNVHRKSSTIFRQLNDGSVKIPNSDDMLDCSGKSGFYSEAEFSTPTLYHPKVVMDRLALPPSQDLVTVLSCSGMPSVLQTNCSSTIPPLPWTFSHSAGNCKPSSEGSKLASVRSTSKGRWVRIARKIPSTDIHCCFTEADSKTSNNERDVEKNKISDLLQFVNSLPESSNSTAHEQYTRAAMPDLHAIQISDSTTVQESSMVISSKLHKFSLLQEKSSSQYDTCLGSVKDEGSLRCQLKVSNSGDTSKDDVKCLNHEAKLKDQPTRSSYDYSTSSSFYPYDNTVDGCNQSSCHFLEKSGDFHFHKEDIAARILCDMLSSSIASKRRQRDGETKESANGTLENTIKIRKFVSSVSKPEGSSKHHDTVESTGQLSSKLRSPAQKTSSHYSNLGRGTLGWPSMAESSPCHGKSDRELVVNPRPMLSSFSRPSGLTRSQVRSEQGFRTPQKHRAFIGSSIKDWSKGRNKRL